MPDFSTCVKAKNGKLYYWDKGRGKFAEVILKEIPTQNVPPEAVESIIKNLAVEQNS